MPPYGNTLSCPVIDGHVAPQFTNGIPVNSDTIPEHWR
jgi:hypothetical protein